LSSSATREFTTSTISSPSSRTAKARAARVETQLAND
jgi:hypothetical protein